MWVTGRIWLQGFLAFQIMALSTTVWAGSVASRRVSPRDAKTVEVHATPVAILPSEQTMSYGDFAERLKESNRDGALVAQQWRHPSVAANGSGVMARMYEYYNGAFDSSYTYINGSVNYGTSWSSCCFLDLFGCTYPSIDNFNSGTRMIGTFVPPNSFQNGGAFMLADVPDPNVPAGWTVTYFSLAGLGWKNMKMADIAAAPYPAQSWNWGFESVIMSRGGLDSLRDVPTLFGRQNNLPFGSYYAQFPHCRTTAVSIDTMNNQTYAVYDYLDTTDSQYKLFFRQDYQYNWTIATDAAILEMTNNNQHLRYPDISVDSGKIIVVASLYDDADSTNFDIVCLRGMLGDVDNIALASVVAGGVDAENYPILTGLVGDTVGCVFVKNFKLYAAWSFDAGANWLAPLQVSAAGDSIVPEYRTTHFNIGIRGNIYAQRYTGNPAAPIAMVGCYLGLPDADADGIIDLVDNCPFGPNPLQEDTDGDGAGDLCDFCPLDSLNDADADGACGNVDNCAALYNPLQQDSDGDQRGNACDNCPTVVNANQGDADHDGTGDACDICADTDGDGFGNPGFAANTCTVDNCPYTPNPLQTDSDHNGVGDACGQCGDVDGNGLVSISDVVFLISYIFSGGLPPTPLSAADVDCNTFVTVSDAVYMIAYIFSGGPAPCAACL